MSGHNLEAAYASTEIAGYIQDNQVQFLESTGSDGMWSLFAGSEGGSKWPLADGVICAKNSKKDINFAFEFKRKNEGVHGILTALGQSYAYLEKGYAASVMAIPESYSSHPCPGEHINRIIEQTSPDIPIWIFTYGEPDMSATRPFNGKIKCVRNKNLGTCIQSNGANGSASNASRVTTLWAHFREGMSHPDALYKYCKSVKIITSAGENLDEYKIPEELKQAVKRINASADVYQYLSNTSPNSISDKSWRKDWFSFYFWKDLMPLYHKDSSGKYIANTVPTKIKINQNDNQTLFSSRNDSIKNKLVEKLNEGKITEDKAWEEYAKKVRSDAHSYREVIDSGLYHIGFVDSDGKLTELGYKYVDACERANDAYSLLPMQILKSAVLQNGQYAALLHYIFKLSEEEFDKDLYSFTKIKNNKKTFDSNEYRTWLMHNLNEKLHLVQTSSLRAGGTRKPLQSEIWMLKKLGLIRSTTYRIGSGICIDWPQVETSLQFFYNI